MSDYATPFADKLLDDKTFDTVFGGEIDDQLMGAVMKECDNFDDQVDTSGIEDGIGAIGKGNGLGSDLGPNHDTNCCGMKPTDDSSDQEIIGKKEIPDHVIDAYKADPTQKAAGNIDPKNIEDETDDLKKTNSFEDAYSNLLKELAEEDYECDIAGSPAPEGSVPPTDDQPNYEYDTDALEDEEDDPIADLVGEEADVAETRDNSAVNDKNEDNLGDDLGPNHDTNCCGMKPTDDSSDEDIIAAVAGEELKNGQLNVGDNACGKIEDGDTVDPKDVRVAGDDQEAADDSFTEADDIEAAVAGKSQQQQKPQQNQNNNQQQQNQNEAANLEDGSTTESEEDKLIDDVENQDVPMKYAVDELNADDDDEVMAAVMGGRV